MTSRRIPTKKELLHLQRLYRTDKRIGQALGDIPEQLVAYWRRKKGIGRSVFPKYSFAEIKELWERFGDDYKAGQQLGITKQAFYRWRKKYKMFDRPAILKLEQLELKFFDEHRLDHKGLRKAPAQTYLQKILSYHGIDEPVGIGDKAESRIDEVIEFDRSGIKVTFRNVKSGGRGKSPQRCERFSTLFDFLESGQFIPGRVIVSRQLEASALAVTASHVEILDQLSDEESVPDKVSVKILPNLKMTVSGTLADRQSPFTIAAEIATALMGANDALFSIQLAGVAVERLSLEDRMALISYLRLLMGRHVFLEPDQIFLNHLQRYGEPMAPVPFSDRDAYYLDELNLTLSRKRPPLYSLSQFEFVDEFREFARKKLKRVRIGPLAGGDLESIKVLAGRLKGIKLDPSLEVFLVPASRRTFIDATRRKYVQQLLESSIRIGNTCYRPPLAPLAEGEYELTTEICPTDCDSYITSTQAIIEAVREGRLTRKLLESN